MKGKREAQWWEKYEELTDEEEEQVLRNTVIIAPGSSFLRIGRASDDDPISIVHCIARKLIKGVENSTPFRECPYRSVIGDENDERFAAEFANIKSAVSKSKLRIDASLRDNALENCDVPPKKDVLIGQDALNADPKEYSLNFPFLFDRFNVHNAIGGTDTAVMQDLVEIWHDVLSSEVALPKSERDKCNAFVIIPNFYTSKIIRCLGDIVIEQLGFGGVQFIPEMHAFMMAAQVNTAVLVDIGGKKSDVACVNEGMVMVRTLCQSKLGGNDVTALQIGF